MRAQPKGRPTAAQVAENKPQHRRNGRVTTWHGPRITSSKSKCVCGWASPLCETVQESDALREEHFAAEGVLA